MRNGGIGMIEEGLLKGRRFIIPSEVWVEKGVGSDGRMEMSKACLIHQKFLPDGPCADCATEVEKQEKDAKAIGLG